MSDYYETLGISRDAELDDVKKAYRRLAMEHHPDRNKGSKEAEERFKSITEAYEVLRDPEKRARFDRYGEEGLRGGQGPGGFGGFDFSDAIEIFMRDFGSFGGLEDVLGQRTRGRPAERKGQNVRVRLPLTLVDVAYGANKRIRISLLEPCASCRGKGTHDGADPVVCQTCGGAGQERTAQRSVFGQFVSVQPCRRCHGEGRVIHDPCPTCHGDGRTRKESEIDVEVPPGVTSENFLTLRGQGHSGPRGGPRGDVMVLLDVEDDPRFVREGSHLVYALPVTFAQAALGAQVEVPTVDGSAEVSVPAGIQTGEVLRLRGLGLPDLNGDGKGDQLVRVIVWTPEDLSRAQREAVERLREVEDPAPERVDGSRKGFWSRVKEAFTT